MTTEWVDTRWGPMEVFTDDPGVSRLVKEYGEYSPGEMAVLSLYLNPKSVVVDVGANIGALTVPMAHQVAKVYAFEPQAEVAQVLRDNTQSLSNVEVHQVGLAEKPGVLRTGPENSGWGPNSPGSFALSATTGSEQVEVRTLDNYGFAPDLIKIDVEGMELNVMAGGLETIKTHRPVIWMERSTTDDTLGKVFGALGYNFCTVDLPMWYPTNFRHNMVNVYPGMAHLSILGIPRA